MIKKFSGLVVTVASLAAVTACQSDSDMPSGSSTGSGHDVVLTVNITKDLGDTSRSLLSEADGNLACTWIAGDRIAVADTKGSFKGILDLVGGENSAEGRFEGTLSDMTDGSADLVFTYLGNSTGLSATETSYTLSYGSQDGTIGSLSNLDILNATVSDVRVAGTQAEINGVELNRRVAFGRFAIILPEGVEAASVTVSGANIATEATVGLDGSVTFNNEAATAREITVGLPADGSGDIYMTVLPTGEITPAFTVTVGEGEDATVYTATLPARTWIEGEYVRSSSTGDDGAASFGGVAVELVKVTPEEPAPTVDDTVGPTFEVGGRKYRFTQGNLKYNTITGIWSICEKQTDFVNAGGLGNLTSLNGGALGVTPEEIGLFAWGATGIEDAQNPWTIRDTNNAATYDGAHWPSTGTTDKNSSVKDLLEADLEYVYDWGNAYMKNGRAANDNRQYITPPQNVFIDLFDKTDCFVQGATVNGVKGLICIPGKFTLAEAKNFINSVDGASCLSSMKEALKNSNGNTTDYKNITITDYDALKKLNDAIFFPAASKRNLANAGSTSKPKPTVYSSNDTGWYWTSYSGTSTNARCLYFNCTGTSSGTFLYKGSNQSGMSRNNQMAVRLMVEVTE